MQSKKEQLIYIPCECIIEASQMIHQAKMEAIIKGADENEGTVEVLVRYDATSSRVRAFISDLMWLKEVMDGYKQGEEISLP